MELKAKIYERGNGFPIVGAYVPGDHGEVYRVVALVGPIHPGKRSGAANYVHALVEGADWDDFEGPAFDCMCVDEDPTDYES